MVEVDVEGPTSVKGLVGSDGVEELPVGLRFEAEVVAAVDLEPVQVLVLERAEGAFADAVLAGALVAGADVDQLRECDERALVSRCGDHSHRPSKTSFIAARRSSLPAAERFFSS